MLDLADDGIDRPVEQLVLVADVPIQRHRLDAERLAEPSHAEACDAVPVCQVDSSLQDALPRQRGASLGRNGLHQVGLELVCIGA